MLVAFVEDKGSAQATVTQDPSYPPKVSPELVITANKPKPKFYLGMAACALLFLLLSGYWFYAVGNSETTSLKLLISNAGEISSDEVVAYTRAIEPLKEFSINSFTTKMFASQAFYSPKLALEQSNIDGNNWLVWFESFSTDNGHVLHFGVTREHIHWQGYVFAKSKEKLPIALAHRLKQLFNLGVFEKSLKHIGVDWLEAMRKKAPDDHDILIQLAQYYEKVGQYDVALSYLLKLSKFPDTELSKAYQLKAHLLAANIYKIRGQFTQAKHSLEAMYQGFSATPLWPLYFEYVEVKSWLEYEDAKYKALALTLQTASNFIKHAQQNSEAGSGLKIDPLRMFKFHILHSIISKKILDDTGKYDHLNQAQAILIEHHLDESNLAIVLYHLALFAQQEKPQNSDVIGQNVHEVNSTTLAYLERILALPRTSDNYWVHDATFNMLVNHFISVKKFDAAMQLLSYKDLSIKQLYLKAELFIAQNKNEQAIFLFENVFEQARINYETSTAIDAALKLYHLSVQGKKPHSEYLAYLESNTDHEWLNRKLSVKSNLRDKN